MNLFQLILLISAGVIFTLFFRQLFSGRYPRRGVDYEAKLPDEQIGGINRPDKTFSKDTPNKNRIDELFEIADESIKKGDNLEAKKALQSLLILDKDNLEALRRLGVVYMNMNDYLDAKETYEKLISLNPHDDLAHSSLANALHKLGENDEAINHHKEAISLDKEYAPHHYNYANTLYDLKREDEALIEYKRALEIDPNFKEAKKMVEELS